MKSVSLKAKFWLFGGVVFILVVIAGVLIEQKIDGVSHQYHSAAEVANIGESLQEALTNGLLSGQALRNSFIDPSDKKALDNLSSAIVALEKSISTLKSDRYKKVSSGFEKFNIQGVYEPFYANLKRLAEKQKNGEALSKDEIAENTKLWRSLKDALNMWLEANRGKKGTLFDAFRASLDALSNTVITFSAILLVLLALFLILFAKSVVSSVNRVRDGLEGFFAFLSRKEANVRPIELDSKDEFGEMASQINNGIESVKKLLLEEESVIEELKEVSKKAQHGFTNFKVGVTANNPALSEAIKEVNTMLESFDRFLSEGVGLLVEYTSGNLRHKHNISGFAGTAGSFLSSTSVLSQFLSELIATIDRYAKELKERAELLSDSSRLLSDSSNQQAASLEETSAAMEEMTSNIQANTEKSQTMARLAEQTKDSAKKGAELANSTSIAMEQIVEATNRINEAVAMIDNIAFQTNILSLNAAVEAATAGEAGKGFAVVAQEVRNLANRAAEATKEIQSIVAQAQHKAKEGRGIIDLMLESFSEINTNINKTTELVKEVATANSEQLQGVEQINDAVAQLDQMTQENAKAAGEVNGVASHLLEAAIGLEKIVSRISYDESVKNRVCDVDLVFDMTKRKIDHVVFKQNNFSRINSERAPWRVVTESECALGQWCSKQSGKSFTASSNWSEFMITHKHVHKGVQDFINEAFGQKRTEELINIGLEIEADTMKVFDHINEVTRENCLSIQHNKLKEPTAQQAPAVGNSLATAKTKNTKAIAHKGTKKETQEWESF